VALGISTRGILALVKLARAYCAMKGAEFVTPRDVLDLMPHVFGHRLILKGGINRRAAAALAVLDEVRANIAAPVEDFKPGGPRNPR
jgi:MoxR-like ATPase